MKHKAEVNKQWESYEWLILRNLQKVEQHIQNFYSVSSHFGLYGEKEREAFVKERLQNLVSRSIS